MDHMFDIKHKIALVPGASRPVGRAIAELFARRGAQLVLPYHSDWPESTDEMKSRFKAEGFDFLAFPCDLTKRDEVEKCCKDIESRFGMIHYLINNIERGGMPIVHGPYDLEHNREQWNLELNTTLTAKWNLFHHSLPLLKKSKEGAVTNISSIAGITGRSGPASLLFNDGYSAANCAIATLTRQWAREAAPHVRVNEIILGLVQGRHGEKTRGWAAYADKQRQALIDHTLLKRTAEPSEIAELVYFITVQASYLTGSRITADGGYCLGGEDVLPMPPGILS